VGLGRLGVNERWKGATFPVFSSGFVEMYMGVDEARGDDEVSVVQDILQAKF
jgi:hypothetical protein